MRKIVDRFFDWLERRAYAEYQRQTHEYLARAADVRELELRMEQLRRSGVPAGL